MKKIFFAIMLLLVALSFFSISEARWYDPQTGRFFSRDPMGEAADANVYRFVGNNPINWVDPYGLFGIAGPGLSNVRGDNPYGPDPNDVPFDPYMSGLMSPIRGQRPGLFMGAGARSIDPAAQACSYVWKDVISPIGRAARYGTPIPILPNSNLPVNPDRYLLNPGASSRVRW